MLPYYLSLIIDESNKSKFEQLYLTYRHTMFWVAQKVLHDPALAEDAVHDAFLRLVNHLENISPEDCNKTRAFVVMIVRHIAIDYLRKKNRLAETDLEECAGNLPDYRSDPEEICLGGESRQEILAALGKMKQIYVDVIALQASYRFDGDEIASLLGISPQTARVRLHRARKILARLLKGDEDPGSGNESSTDISP
jgi:RNA polymerase sigma-70 factor, ECF subfamily